VDNLGGWLTTVVARVCLSMLRSRTTRREEPLTSHADLAEQGEADPEQQALLADSLGPALLVVLDVLTPAERLAFVLHDMFGVPFEEIARIVGRSPAAARQLASRARRRVRGTSPPDDADPARQRRVVDAFFAAAREGDFESLLAVLDHDVVLRADRAAVDGAATAAAQGAPAPILATRVHGADAVARSFAGRAVGARSAWVDGAPGAVWAPDGRPRVAYRLTVRDDRIVEIQVVADPARLDELVLVVDP
jgi:RNA polymerase sigma-70 factor (ECF subfamily)